MTEMTVIDSNDRVVYQCADFEIREYGLITKTANGDETGFFPFGSFAYVRHRQQQSNQQQSNQQQSNQQQSNQQQSNQQQ